MYFMLASCKWANLKPLVLDQVASVANLEAIKIDDDYSLVKIRLTRRRDLDHR